MNFDLTTGMAVLERTPRTLRAMLAGLPPAWTDATEGPDTWSPYVIVGHLIHGERANWIPRAQIILAQGAQRRFTPFDRLTQFRESRGSVARVPPGHGPMSRPGRATAGAAPRPAPRGTLPSDGRGGPPAPPRGNGGRFASPPSADTRSGAAGAAGP